MAMDILASLMLPLTKEVNAAFISTMAIFLNNPS